MTIKEQIIKDSYAVLLPAFTELSLSLTIRNFLTNGGCSILLAETREEYVNREMSAERQQNETQEAIKQLIDEAKKIQPGLIVAVDQELVGINRLHVLSSNTPTRKEVKLMNPTALESICSDIAIEAREMGVNCFLAPTLDIVKGKNPWLLGRTWTTDVYELIKISAAFIKWSSKREGNCNGKTLSRIL
ncbi:hypothetical protein GCM10011506_04850 [Marivirga lumbricoides]|uniref:Glycoside hydrolase family 3 N-terminal domain-containing protein n=1 Tax=Marivirga lumbricoides TaxID=1046115 RepID=A0ABQ1LCH1_9BACT|nr:hypothetical protein GCM10011506_04850 [Marivirga lumbricoides]